MIIAIGAQNAFVLTQGIRKQFRFTIALICALCDTVLISLGVAGLGAVIEKSPILLTFASLGGALFLFIYGVLNLKRATRITEGMNPETQNVTSLKQIIITTLAITLLNPHVYLDTVVLLGSIGSTFPSNARYLFALGAIFMSFLWFFSLSYGSTLLSPLFRKAITWKVLDILIAMVMWVIAFNLMRFSGLFDF